MSDTVLGDPFPTSAFATFASTTCFASLPAEVVLQAQQSVLDVFGIALAGARMNADCARVTAYCECASGTADATLWATGTKLAPGYAALANAAHARALDYDDIIEYPQIHVAACVVPAAVAVAERLRSGAGKALLTGVAVGCEIQARLAAALAPYFGSGLPVMLASQVFGYFSAAAACGNVLTLSNDALHDALGLALMQAAGTEETVVHTPVSMGKFLYSGLSNQGGVQSALMAACGVEARGEVLSGTAGLFNAYFGGRYDAPALTDGLGTHYRALRRCFKTMPGTLVAHAFVEAAQTLVDTHRIEAAQIRKAILHVGPWGRVMCEPFAMRREPPGATAAMNSIPYLVARMLVKRRIGIDDFDEAARGDPAVREMALRIAHAVDDGLARPGGLEPGIVELHLSDGREFTQRVDVPAGHPSRPLGFDDVARKFRNSVRDARVALMPATVDTIIQQVSTLDTLDDLSPLLRLLSDDPNSRGMHAS